MTTVSMASMAIVLLFAYCNAATTTLGSAWFSPKTQKPTPDQTIVYTSPVCYAQSLNGASCIFSANLFPQPWNPRFQTWTSMVLESSNGAPIVNNTVTQLSAMSFIYQAGFGALSTYSTAGNSADLDFTYSMFCTPTSLSKRPFLGGSGSDRSPWLYKPDFSPPEVVTMKQYAATKGVSQVNTGVYATYLINFCFDATATYTTVEIGIQAVDQVSAMQSYLCVNSVSCIPGDAVASDTSAGGYLSMSFRLNQAQYGPMAVTVEGLGQFGGVNTYVLWAKML